MTPSDPKWPLINSVEKVLQNKPKIVDKYYEKRTITILGSERNYYVTGYRGVKTEVTSFFLGSELPLQTVSFSRSS